MPGIRLESIHKSFGAVKAVNDLNLMIPDKAFMCFLGPSGCGKTTILRMIAGLEEPTEGRITIGDTVVFDSKMSLFRPPADRDMGLVFQSYAIWPHMTVYENIAFGLEMKKVKKSEISKRINDVTRWIRIDDLLDRYPSELSGGQQQRVAMARSLAPVPQGLLLDEPLSNLDAKLRVEMRAELKHIHKEIGQTIIYVTHDQQEALSLGTHVAVMNEGVLQQVAHPLEIYRSPANVFVATFIGMPPINLIEGITEKSGNRTYVRAESGAFVLDESTEIGDNQEVLIGIRPEDITLHPKRDGIAGWEFAVYSNQPAGAEAVVQVHSGSGITLTTRMHVDDLLPENSEVICTFQKAHILLFDKRSGVRINADVFVEYNGHRN
ncbi:MAG: ABC transporter ATP-binding protein [Spirochaetaceae bacterium]